MSEKRFAFGRNWASFSRQIDGKTLETAQVSLQRFLGKRSLYGLRVLDIGCGSGLFSAAAASLGAREIVAFDYDIDSVGTTRSVLSQMANGTDYRVSSGDVLDRQYVESLGRFDLVYAWGVLHHTGAMWQAIDNAAVTVAPGGLFYLALYNDQGAISRAWLSIKRLYNVLPTVLREVIVIPYYLASLLVFGSRRLGGARRSRHLRGMRLWTDARDWIGGLPFETASPVAVTSHLAEQGFRLMKQETTRGHGCNEFLFRRENGS